MFFFFPWGHDQPVYERPWLTYSLVIACALIYALSFALDVQAERDLQRAAVRVEGVLAAHPDARVTFTVEGLPEGIDEIIQPMIDTSPHRSPRPGDQDLEAAMRDVVSAMNGVPALRFGYRPARPSLLTAVSHAFMHGGFFHLFGNMVMLLLAGAVLECFWRRWAYALLYLAALLAGVTAHHFSDPTSFTPMVGASGAIAGLMGAFLVGYPRTRIRIFWFFFFFYPRWGNWMSPAWVAIPLWVGTNLFSALLGSTDGVAYWAHLGGFSVGVVAALIARALGLVATDAGHEIVRSRELPGLPIATPAGALPPRPPRTSAAPQAPIELPLPRFEDDDDLIERRD